LKRLQLVSRIRSQISEELAIDCMVDLVPLHTLPRTSSGKLSRSEARRNFMCTRKELSLTGADGATELRSEPIRQEL
jgi:fatty-acyl-CoA synthase